MAVAERVRHFSKGVIVISSFVLLIAQYMIYCLFRQRWNIATAETGEEAIELLKTQSFDLIVLDHHLGDGINGEEVGRFAR
jgi:CheY-like chemotaxis protein